MSDKPPTLEELRKIVEQMKRPSRFHKSACPKCGAMVTNQAMGRKAHRMMHIRKGE